MPETPLTPETRTILYVYSRLTLRITALPGTLAVYTMNETDFLAADHKSSNKAFADAVAAAVAAGRGTDPVSVELPLEPRVYGLRCSRPLRIEPVTLNSLDDLVIEHDVDLWAEADWILDLGPEGGDGGGRIVDAGPPLELARRATGHTGRVLGEFYAARAQRRAA